MRRYGYSGALPTYPTGKDADGYCLERGCPGCASARLAGLIRETKRTLPEPSWDWAALAEQDRLTREANKLGYISHAERVRREAP